MKYHSRLKILFLGSVLAWSLLGVAQAQLGAPLAIGNANPVLDYLDQPLRGTWLGDSNLAARIEVRELGAGISAPDPVTGAGNDTANPLLLVTHMGYGVIGTTASGKFSYSLADRLSEGVYYFARVYDAAQPSEAYYYANTVAFKDVPPAQQSTTPTLNVVFQSMYRVDGEEDSDYDGDGIPDTIEDEVTGTSPTDPDSDHDGYNDGFEQIYTAYVIEGSNDATEIVLHTPVYNEPPSDTNKYYVSWRAIPGVEYQVGYREEMTNGLDFIDIWQGVADDSQTNWIIQEVYVDEWVKTNAWIKGFFRFMVP